ncbi:MAG: hypothetical protein KKG47_15430 [Proteobacteria bacterium]|nr:hypothetical protein [Pseudomonadota bacterium]MBU1737978.1 hypothetical protein [Pseudomonadota bacterium]
MTDDRESLLADELLIVRHSGEIPEVALHGAIYFLTEDPDGPGLVLEEKELRKLKKMVVDRYREIIHRDLNPDNRDKSLYRGIARCIANWRRLEKFCGAESFDLTSIHTEVREALLSFLQTEACDVETKQCCSSVNCSSGELECFLETLALDGESLPDGWQKLCSEETG